VLDPSSPREAKDMVAQALELSERFEVPVMVRPTTRVCHARQNVPCEPPLRLNRPARFDKDPRRWCATPMAVLELHRELNVKIEKIAGLPEFAPRLTPGDCTCCRACIIASGVAFAHTSDCLDALGLLGRFDLFQVTMPYPLNRDFIHQIKIRYQKALVIEETSPVIELQLANPRVQGRTSGLVPREGELTPDVIRPVLESFLELPPRDVPAPPSGGDRPTLCAGCAHRAAFYAIKTAFPAGIFPSDIGCYTLGLNLGAVDTCHCMGAGISQAAGFYRAYAAGGGEFPAIVATIGDSTFFHAGVPALVNAVFHRARFILVILDNATTAMTGHQPTPQVGFTATGEHGHPVFIPDLVRASGAGFLQEADPYDLPAFMDLLKEADAYCRSPEGGVAVIIAKHPCLLDRGARGAQAAYVMDVSEDCTGCRHCLDDFECPALSLDETGGRVVIDAGRCIGCGVCVHVCPEGAITANTEGRS
jgi:indolepyruvate ferredoxin oxidoreductase, alpha subunit